MPVHTSNRLQEIDHHVPTRVINMNYFYEHSQCNTRLNSDTFLFIKDRFCNFTDVQWLSISSGIKQVLVASQLESTFSPGSQNWISKGGLASALELCSYEQFQLVFITLYINQYPHWHSLLFRYSRWPIKPFAFLCINRFNWKTDSNFNIFRWGRAYRSRQANRKPLSGFWQAVAPELCGI